MLCAVVEGEQWPDYHRTEVWEMGDMLSNHEQMMLTPTSLA
jgi:hypothetical protein